MLVTAVDLVGSFEYDELVQVSELTALELADLPDD